jgi:hypothetical protein
MNRVESDSGQIDQTYVPVEAAIKAEIAEVRGNPITVAGVVTADNN